MDKVWREVERAQGKIAGKLRELLGETAYDERIFTAEERQRRIDALKQCAAENTSDESRHAAWCKMHTDNGWVFGEKFDPQAKTHPNLLPWEQLPHSTRVKAAIFAIMAELAAELAAE